MTAEERQTAFDAAVVTDLDALPPAFLEQARRDAETAVARTAARQARRSDARPEGGAARSS
jgi:hypothetical protein